MTNSWKLAKSTALGAMLVLCIGARAADAPVLDVTTLSGSNLDLSALRGQVVLVHFWATWCVPCIQEMPALGSFYEKYKAKGIEIIAVSQDRTRDIEEVHHMVHHMNMSYPVAMAHQAKRNSFGEQAALPVTYVIDATGVVRAEMRPDKLPVTMENLEKTVLPLIPAH